jgi:hypothetical protein
MHSNTKQHDKKHLKPARLGLQYWDEAMTDAIFITNTPTNDENLTPSQIFVIKERNINHYKLLGCKVLIINPEHKTKSLLM